MLFEQKKIQIETLSEYLRQVREYYSYELEEVADKTGIKLKFLEALESGKFLLLPPDVYVAGFLRQLASVYSVDYGVLLQQYKKERLIQQQVNNQGVVEKGWRGKIFKGLVITPKLLSLAGGAIFVLFTAGYIVWQVFSINRTPHLEIYQPQSRQVITESFVNVEGKTDPGMSVTINNDPVFVERDGSFKKQVGLSSGPKSLVVAAKNKFDKSVSITLEVMGQPLQQPKHGQLELRLEFSADVNISISLDGQPVQDGLFHKGDSKTFLAENKIVLSTSDAGATRAVLNNQILGPLGRPGEELQNIRFFPESDSFNTSDE